MCWKGVSFGLLVPLCGIVAPFGPEPTGGGSPERLWTRNRAGALPAEALRCKLPVGRETKMEILAYNVNDGSNRDLPIRAADRKSTRLNSSHDQISYAVFCLKK